MKTEPQSKAYIKVIIWEVISWIKNYEKREYKRKREKKNELLSWPSVQVTGPQISMTCSRERFIKYVARLLSPHTSRWLQMCKHSTLELLKNDGERFPQRAPCFDDRYVPGKEELCGLRTR